MDYARATVRTIALSRINRKAITGFHISRVIYAIDDVERLSRYGDYYAREIDKKRRMAVAHWNAACETAMELEKRVETYEQLEEQKERGSR